MKYFDNLTRAIEVSSPTAGLDETSARLWCGIELLEGISRTWFGELEIDISTALNKTDGRPAALPNDMCEFGVRIDAAIDHLILTKALLDAAHSSVLRRAPIKEWLLVTDADEEAFNTALREFEEAEESPAEDDDSVTAAGEAFNRLMVLTPSPTLEALVKKFEIAGSICGHTNGDISEALINDLRRLAGQPAMEG